MPGNKPPKAAVTRTCARTCNEPYLFYPPPRQKPDSYPPSPVCETRLDLKKHQHQQHPHSWHTCMHKLRAGFAVRFCVKPREARVGGVLHTFTAACAPVRMLAARRTVA